MYLLFRYHDILPSQFVEMGLGERTVLRSFMHYEVEKRNQEVSELEKMWR